MNVLLSQSIKIVTAAIIMTTALHSGLSVFYSQTLTLFLIMFLNASVFPKTNSASGANISHNLIRL